MSQPPVEERGDRRDADRPQRAWLVVVLPVVWLVLGLVGGLAIIWFVRADDSPAPADVTSQGPTDAAKAPKKTKKKSEPTESPATTEPTTEPTTEAPATRSIGVSVYNQIGIGGLAGRVAAQARAAGWMIGAIDDWRGSVPQDTIYHPPGQQAEAALLGSDLGITRILPATANMSGSFLTVVLASPR